MKIDMRSTYNLINECMDHVKRLKRNPLVWNPFLDDIRMRLSWNSNTLEGNTLSLDETIALINYDEVTAGHTYTEYQEAKGMYQAVSEKLNFEKTEKIDCAWIKKCNALILFSDGNFRKNNLYIGTVSEAVYYPPAYEKVEGLMSGYVRDLEMKDEGDIESVICKIAENHIKFERIHPFPDGNGRTGRMIMNQQLLNYGVLPAIIKDQSKYRQAFRRYEKNGELALMEYVIAEGIVETYGKLRQIEEKYIKALGISEKEAGELKNS